MDHFEHIGIVGAGGWGTALACLIAEKNVPVTLWGHNLNVIQEIGAQRCNHKYLPGIRIPANITLTNQLSDLLDADLILFVTPSKVIRDIASQLALLAPNKKTVWVSCTKGIEHDSGNLMTEILEEELGTDQVAVLSGPNLAIEVANKIPAAAVIGCAQEELCKHLQHFFTFPTFRTYTSSDVKGIQLGGALKNIFAIGAGCSDGFAMGNNAKAALVTRSLAEMMRLGTAMGGQRETFYGLSGIGDLMVTCFSELSRNRRLGERLGQGEKLAEIQTSMQMVAEGVPSTLGAWQRAKQLDIESPIVDGIYAVLYQNQCPRDIMGRLLGRSPKAENA